MSETQAVTVQQPKRSLVATLASQYDMEPQPFLDAIQQTVMPTNVQVSNAMVAAFLLVCNEHGLNPFTREIFAFPTKSGGIQPIVSVDGWVKLVNQHPQFAGMDIQMSIDEKTGKPISCTCTIFRKDREHPTPITEYYDECVRNTDPWNKMPKRMMRHKALKEAARYTFGFAGILDEDEGRDAINITGESTELERSTTIQTSKLKEKIDAKKAKLEQPNTKPVPEPTAITSEEKAAILTTPVVEPVVTTPAPAPAPEAKMSEEHRKAFLDAASTHGFELAMKEPDIKAKMREIVFSMGATKFVDLPASKFDEAMQLAKTFTV
jgi:phage recombination protein Bet